MSDHILTTRSGEPIPHKGRIYVMDSNKPLGIRKVWEGSIEDFHAIKDNFEAPLRKRIQELEAKLAVLCAAKSQ